MKLQTLLERPWPDLEDTTQTRVPNCALRHAKAMAHLLGVSLPNMLAALIDEGLHAAREAELQGKDSHAVTIMKQFAEGDRFVRENGPPSPEETSPSASPFLVI